MTEELQKQTQAYLEVNGPMVGDCWRTAVACLLEIPRDEVPHFIQQYRDWGDYTWWFETVKFVEEVKPGWTLVTVPPVFPVYTDVTNCIKSVILTGKSPRGDWNHCVIGDSRDGTVLWDPHPTRGGLAGIAEIAALTEKDIFNDRQAQETMVNASE